MAKSGKKKRRAPPRNPGGRPSKYRPEFVDQARKLAELGLTDHEIADFFQVSRMSLHKWRGEYPEFRDAMKAGKEPADDRVEQSLFHRAVGYTFASEKIFLPAQSSEALRVPITEHVPPDTTACIFWLKNRQPTLWRDRSQHEHSGPEGGPIVTKEASDMAAATQAEDDAGSA
jgi:hypothetical protein